MRYRYHGKTYPYALSLAIVYWGIKYLNPQNAEWIMLTFIAFFIPLLFLRKFITNYMYRCSINIVPRQYVLNPNTIQNNQCSVSYTPSKKIIVMDSMTNVREQKRIFTVQNVKNIDEMWNKICKMFDNFTTLDSLSTFFNYGCNVNVVPTVISRPKVKQPVNVQKPSVNTERVDIGTIQADEYLNKKAEGYSGKAGVIDFENMNKQKAYEEKPEVVAETFDISDIATKFDAKIDVNLAEASELAILPGINIAMAKKLVEIRNVNGYFKTSEDFLAAANVKEHFIKKIKDMIIVKIPEQKSDDNDDYQDGRVVDF